MSDFDTMAREYKMPGHQRCSVARVIDELSEQQVADLRDALKVHTAPIIVKVLRSWGHPVSENSVQRHKRGACMCND